MLRHVVVWSVKGDLDRELNSLLRAISDLPAQIHEIEGLSCGRLVNESEFDAVLVVDFADTVAFDRYRRHSAHQPVLEELRRIARKIVVADYRC